MSKGNNVLADSTVVRVYECTVAYFRKHGYAPTCRELIADAGITAYSLKGALKSLEEAGYIQRDKKKQRALRLCHYKLVERL